MMQGSIYCSRPSCWAPGLEGTSDWLSWAQGQKDIEYSPATPNLEFTTPLFRRRLSQISRMTVQVVHDLKELAECGDIKQSFVSLRGEIARQLSVDKTLIQEGDVMPAAFSLSVFNAPIALASIACGLKSGYSAIFPAGSGFYDGLVTAISPLLSESVDRLMLVYADELIPEEYAGTWQPESPDDGKALAFACVISLSPSENCGIPFTLEAGTCKSPASFLKALLLEA
ncbi:MAG: beta-ketoacyl synthase chain length factor [Treponema sp.]|nr:beta-ketoacyl synthase chain length factor [Treponema sp.]